MVYLSFLRPYCIFLSEFEHIDISEALAEAQHFGGWRAGDQIVEHGGRKVAIQLYLFVEVLDIGKGG